MIQVGELAAGVVLYLFLRAVLPPLFFRFHTWWVTRHLPESQRIAVRAIFKLARKHGGRC